jgi:hypothetical protein
VERVNRALKDTTVKKHHDLTHHHLREYLQAFLIAYNLEFIPIKPLVARVSTVRESYEGHSSRP